MKYLMYTTLFLSLLAPPAFAQNTTPQQHQIDVQDVFKMIHGALDDQDCRNENRNPYKDYYCQLSSRTLHPRLANISESSISPLAYQITGLVIIGISYLMEIKSIGTASPTLSPLENLIISSQAGLKKYILSKGSLDEFKNCNNLNELFQNGFSRISYSNASENNIRFSWKSGVDAQPLSKTVSVETFQEMLLDITKISPKNYVKYLDTYREFDEAFLKTTTEEMFELKLLQMGKVSSLVENPMLRRSSLGIGFVGLGLIIIGELLDPHERDIERKQQHPQMTPQGLNKMVQYDAHEFRQYVLDPNPELTKYLANYARQIPDAMIQFHKVQQSVTE